MMVQKVKQIIKFLISKSGGLIRLKSSMTSDEALHLLQTYSPKPIGNCFAENSVVHEYDLKIIIPAYNAEKFIKECLDSIISQRTEYKVLVTVVNDGSTDSTKQIVSDYVSRNVNDKIRVRVINQENRGYSGARNAGLSNIEGKYVMFVDSDDILPENTISMMMDKAFMTGADILQGSWYQFGLKNKIEKNVQGVKGYVSGYPWGKLFKSEVLKNFQFPNNYWFEDTPISFIIAAMPLKIVTMEEVIYGYRINPNGITANAMYSKKCIDSYWVTELCLEEFSKYNLSYDQRAYEFLLRQSVQNVRRARKTPRKVREAEFILLVDLMEKYFKGFSAKDNKLKKIEAALKNKQFIRFELVGVYL